MPVANAEIIKSKRHQFGWSQEEAAAAAGISVRTLRNIESAKVVSVESVRAIAGAFNIPDFRAVLVSDESPAPEIDEQLPSPPVMPAIISPLDYPYYFHTGLLQRKSIYVVLLVIALVIAGMLLNWLVPTKFIQELSGWANYFVVAVYFAITSFAFFIMLTSFIRPLVCLLFYREKAKVASHLHDDFHKSMIRYPPVSG